jgi:MoaA/NifB/PqqE/SkfB family radical SAM enzyme
MYKYTHLRQVHLEITSRCNASCPQCARNVNGGKVNPHLPLTELSISDVKKIFPQKFIQQLSLMYMCGNYGDPLVARDTVEVFRYFRACNPAIELKMHTNGSGRPPGWWAQLAQLVDSCCFGIDGLEDTNAIYRRGTQWKVIMRAAEAFIEAGGNAEWQFLVFGHNEHQVDEARRLSQKLGFRKFFVKRTARFMNQGVRIDTTNVMGREGHIVGNLTMPENPAYQNQALVKLGGIIRNPAEYKRYLDTTAINCKAVIKSSVYVTAEALVFPCCWTAGLYPWQQPLGSSQIWTLIDKLPEGKNSLNATMRPLKDIVDGPFFQEGIPGGWDHALAGSRLRACAQHCGAYEVDKAQTA